MNKSSLRKQMRRERQCLSVEVKADAGLSVLSQLRKLSQFHASKRTAIYLANDGELPLSAIATDIWRRKQRCLLPVIFGYRQRTLHFSDYQNDSFFQENRYGIPEPVLPISKQTKPMHLDLVLMPLVAFDDAGNRVGMGGGFYDRSFSFLARRQRWRKPYLIGVAYDFQKVDSLIADRWDIPLDAIVTPSQVIQCK